MPINKGKQFEQKVVQDLKKCFKETDSILLRLPDQMNGYKTTSQNICDFILYADRTLYLIECKSCKGNTFPLTNLTQYDKLCAKVGIPGVRSGVFLWFIAHQAVAYVPTSTITQMKKDGKKSVNIKMLDTGDYNIKVIPSITKRVFPECDYSVLKELKIGE